MSYLIKNGRVIDPLQHIDETLDIVIDGPAIVQVGKKLAGTGHETVDASGMIVAPGFVDMHVHLREPGREDKETVATGTAAALTGGFTSVACMPNTDPALDTAERLDLLKAIIKRDALVNVFPVAAITLGRAGKELVDMRSVKNAGAHAVSDDGSSVDDAALMGAALDAAHRAGLLTIVHCEDAALARQGVINEGFISTKMGLRGIPRRAEYERIARDMQLARAAKAPIHIAHVSCKESVELIRAAKREGTAVSAETAPHYFSLTDSCCVSYDTNTKMNPPLRGADDVAAIKAGLADGTIDAIATDHAPHTDSEKDVEFDYAPFGIIGLETALSLAIMELVGPKVISWAELITKLSVNPARLLRLDRGTLAVKKPADIIIIDPAKEYTYTAESIVSKSKNSPFINWRLKGKVVHAWVGGKYALRHEKIAAGG